MPLNAEIRHEAGHPTSAYAFAGLLSEHLAPVVTRVPTSTFNIKINYVYTYIYIHV